MQDGAANRHTRGGYKPAPPVFLIPPLLPWAVGLIIGIAVDSARPVQPLLCAVFLALSGAALVIRAMRRRAAIILAAVAAACLGAMLHHRAYYALPANHLVSFAGADKAIARVVGCVTGRPKTYSRGYEPFTPWLFETDRTSFVLEARAVETRNGLQPVCGKVRVTVKEAALAVREGALVEVFGWLYRPREPRNPGQFNWALFHARRGVWVNMSCDTAHNVRVLERAAEGSVSALARIRDRVRRLLLDDRIEAGDESVSLLDAMVLGRRAGMDRDIERSFVATGCAHYLAASGIHVGMLALAVWLPFRLAGASRARTGVVVMAAVVCYALLADPRPPIMRAAIMACTLCFAHLLRRRRSISGALCLAAIVILIADPLSLFDIGFQLSFITAVGLVYLFGPVNELAGRLLGCAAKRLRGGAAVSAEIEALSIPANGGCWWLTAAGRATRTALCVAVTAWICSLPTVAAGFGRIAPWGWLNSFLAFPIVLAVMVLGFTKVAVGAAFPVMADVVDVLLSLCADLLLGAMALLERIPGTVRHVSPPPWWVSGTYFLSLSAWAACFRGWITRRAAAGTVATLVVALVVWGSSRSTPPGLRITQLAVGRGTSTVIELPDGRVWLYDAGASGSFDPGAAIIVPYLRFRGIHRVDGIVISHPNLDHFGGLPSVLAALDCGPVYVPPVFEALSEPRTPSRALLSCLRDQAHSTQIVGRGTPLELGNGVEVEVLWPPPEAPAQLGSNDASVVLRLRYKGYSILLTGDIGYAAQQKLLEQGDLSADVLVLPHHGAVAGNTGAFLRAVGANHLVRSSFVRDADSFELMSMVGAAAVYNTAEVGAVEVLLDGTGVTVGGFTAQAPPPDVHAPGASPVTRQPE